MRYGSKFGLRVPARLAATGLLLLSSTAGAAQDRLDVAPGGWTIDYGDIRCSLARRLGGSNSPIFVLTSWLGRDEAEVLLMQAGPEPLPQLPSRVTIVLDQDARTENGRVRSRNLASRRIDLIEGIAEGFIDRFASARAVRIEARGRPLVNLAIPGAREAVAALRACNDDLLRGWGVDPDLARRLRTPARQIAGTINHSDYPYAALSRNESGVVVARFTIGTDGHVSNCEPVVRTRAAILNSTTCNLITSRYRYEPAIGPDGQPVAQSFIQTVRWLLPSG